MSTVPLNRRDDVLQSIKEELQTSEISPEEIVNLASEIVKAKYAVNGKKRGKVELSNSLVSLMLSKECFFAEDGSLLALDDRRRINAVQQALKIGIAALHIADLLGTTRESIRDRILDFVDEVLKDIEAINSAGIAGYPVVDGAGWRLLLEGDLDQPECMALLSTVMSQNKLVKAGSSIVDIDRLLCDQNNLKLFMEIKELLRAQKKTDKEVEMAKEKINDMNESLEDLKKELESNGQQKEKNKIPLWKAALILVAGVGAGVAGAYAYNRFVDDTTVYSGN